MTIHNIDAKTAQKMLSDKQAILLDVREPAEFASEHIAGAASKPLSSICCGVLPKTEQKIIIHCQRGGRGATACERLVAENDDLELYHLEGGIEAWKQAQLPVNRSAGKKHLPLDRQVQLTIGASVLTFSLLAVFVDANYALGAAFFGAGLTNAGLTGWCGLGRLMAKMPWNQ